MPMSWPTMEPMTMMLTTMVLQQMSMPRAQKAVTRWRDRFVVDGVVEDVLQVAADGGGGVESLSTRGWCGWSDPGDSAALGAGLAAVARWGRLRSVLDRAIRAKGASAVARGPGGSAIPALDLQIGKPAAWKNCGVGGACGECLWKLKYCRWWCQCDRSGCPLAESHRCGCFPVTTDSGCVSRVRGHC